MTHNMERSSKLNKDICVHTIIWDILRKKNKMFATKVSILCYSEELYSVEIY